MKEEDSNPLEPVGDEPIEARIVAWVLGDASAFEAAELERLCAENPEWEVFRRRMQSLHGLLAEAGDSAPDDQWKLSPDRRAKVEALFHAPTRTTTATLLKPKRKGQPWIRQALMASAACLVLAAGFRYVFAPAKEVHTALAVNGKVGVMSSRKPSDTFWAGRDLPVAEGYASSQPVLPEIAEVDEDRLTRSELVPDRPMGGGLKAGGGGWGSGAGRGIAAADAEPEPTIRSRSKAAPAKPAAAAPIDLAAQRHADRGSLAGMPFGAPATPPPAPAITAAPGQKPAEQPEIAAASDKADVAGIVSGGLRSGEAAITRNNIDAVLNNPNRAAGEKEEAPMGGLRRDLTKDLGTDGAADLAKNESGGVEGEIHIGYSSDYIFHDADEAPKGAVDFEKAKGSASARSLADIADAAKAAPRPSSAPASDMAFKEKGSKEQGQLGLASESSLREEEQTKSLAARARETTDNKQAADYRMDLKLGKSAADGKDFSNLEDMGRLAKSDSQTNNATEWHGQTLSGGLWYGFVEQEEPFGGAASIPDHYSELDTYGEVSKDLGIASATPPAGGAQAFDGFVNHGAPIDAPADPFSASTGREDHRRLSPSPPAKAEGKPSAAPEARSAVAIDALSPAEPEQAQHGLAVNRTPSTDATGMEDLKKALQEQEDKVDEKRKLLTNIVRTKAIILTGQESIYRSEINGDDESAVSARDTANKLEQEKIQLESQIQTLQKSDDQQLLSYAAGLNLPENITKTLYPQYLEQQRQVDKLKTDGLADDHPQVVAQKKALANMKSQLDEGVSSLKENLRGQLALADNRLMKFKVLSDEKQGAALERSIDSTDYLRAKTDLENAQDKLKALKTQLAFAAAKTKAQPKPAPVPTDETVAATEPFSTFSLHVSDASFKLAKAALDRGERLSPDQIRTEEFYNAFDYGDPAPAPGEPVACTIEQAAHPVLPQRNIVRVAMRVGSAGRGQGQPLNLTLLLDNSGSMEREDRHEGLKAAIAQLASLLQPGDTVTLAGFSRTPHLLADRLSGAEAGKLVELVDKLPSEGGTNLEEALKLAGELAIQRKNPAAQNRIVLLTDGAANLGNAQPEDLAQKVAALRQQGIAFDAAGIGAGGLNDRMLEALTRHGNGRYYIVNDPKDADANFAKQLAGAFRPAAENVKVQVHFNPDRVSRYKLIGFEKHRLNTEDFHNDAVDAAELAADEAGVALYQVETRPDGSGEIGEVSVRFRDTAAGHMVENTWTIPHDEKTPAFDQARPSIQLATLSMLAAEKLRGGPLAEATDFTTLSPVITRVKNYYSTSSRVGELTDMTGKLR